MTPPLRPWWQTSLLVAIIAMAAAGLALYLPPGRATVVLVVGAGVFTWTFWHNPAFWLRRLARPAQAAVMTPRRSTRSPDMAEGLAAE